MPEESPIRGAETLMHPLRYRIVEALLKEPKGLYINQLADLLGEERQLVSFHLLTLSSHGFVQGDYAINKQPASMGKAVKIYRLTPKVEATVKALRKELDQTFKAKA